MKKGHNTVIINREKGNGKLAQEDQIRPQGEYEEQNEEKFSTIPSVYDLLEQPLLNKTSEDEIKHDVVGQSDLDEDQMMQEDDLNYSSVRDRSRSPRERNTGGRQGEKTIPIMKQSSEV